MPSFALPVPPAELGIFLGRALVAVLLGAVIGAERQWRSRMAGLRTNALVALGASLFDSGRVLARWLGSRAGSRPGR